MFYRGFFGGGAGGRWDALRAAGGGAWCGAFLCAAGGGGRWYS